MAFLSARLDLVAFIRENGDKVSPEPTCFANIAEQEGVYQLTVHLREDRKGIGLRDIKILNETMPALLNIEITPSREMIAIVKQFKPHQVTLVADCRDNTQTKKSIVISDDTKEIISELRESGVRVGVCLEPDMAQIKLAERYSVNSVYLDLTEYTRLFYRRVHNEELKKICKCAKEIKSNKQLVFGMGGINYRNLIPLQELQIFDGYVVGHALMSRSLTVGFRSAIQNFINKLNK